MTGMKGSWLQVVKSLAVILFSLDIQLEGNYYSTHTI